MAKLMFKNLKNKRGKDLYRDVETGLEYEKIEGGLSWPGALPAFICVLGQQDKTGILQVLNENYEDNMDDLSRRCITLESLYFVKNWIADCEGANKCFEDILHDIGKSLDKTIRLTQPSLANDLNLAIQLIRRQFNQNALVIPERGILQSRIEQLNQTDLTQPQMAGKFYEIQILANVVYKFPRPDEIAERNRSKDAWGDWSKDEGQPGSWMRA